MITYIPTLLDLFTHFKANVYDLPRHMVGTVDSKTTKGRNRKGFGDLRTGREDCRKECCFVTWRAIAA